MRGVYIGNGRVLVSTTWGGKLLVSSGDLSLAPELIIYGVYDVPLTNYLLKNITAGDTVIDVGANLGCFTVLMGHLVGRAGKVVAYEANPATCALLRDNVSMNYLNVQTEVVNKAAYSEETTLSFYQTEKFHGNASLYKHDDSYFGYFGDEKISEVKVAAEPLDIHLGNFDRIRLVKIDVEGAEYDVFQGMKKLLDSRAVDTVVFELNRSRLGNRWFPFYNLLLAYQQDYFARFYTITNEGVLQPAELDPLFAKGEIPAVVMRFAHSGQVRMLLELSGTCLSAIEYIDGHLASADGGGAKTMLANFAAAVNQVEKTLAEFAAEGIPSLDDEAVAGFKENVAAIVRACEKNDCDEALRILRSGLLPAYREWRSDLTAIFNPWKRD